MSLQHKAFKAMPVGLMAPEQEPIDVVRLEDAQQALDLQKIQTDYQEALKRNWVESCRIADDEVERLEAEKKELEAQLRAIREHLDKLPQMD